MNITSFWKRVFAYVIKNLMMRSSWMIWTPNPLTGILIRDTQQTGTGRRGWGPGKMEANQSYIATSQGMAGVARNWNRQGRICPRAFGGSSLWRCPTNTLISEFWTPQLWENKFLLSHRVCDNLLHSPRKLIHLRIKNQNDLCCKFSLTNKTKSVFWKKNIRLGESWSLRQS